ncbi:hypothetical protein ACIODS_28635 [Micromonospora chalcea]
MPASGVGPAEEGLTHPRLPEFWQMVDLILERDTLVRRHLVGA